MEFNIDTLAALARIRLTEEEKKSLSTDLENILTYIKQINELTLGDIPPTSHALDLENVFRDDEVTESSKTAEKVIEVLPPNAKDGKFFRVPKVIEGIE